MTILYRPGRLASALLLSIGSLASAEALACSCMQPAPPLESARRADAVFVGMVRAERLEQGEFILSFEVQTRIKGPRRKMLEVRTPIDSAACGLHFQQNVGYLVYAYRQGRVLHTNLCSRTTRASEAGEEIAELRREKR